MRKFSNYGKLALLTLSILTVYFFLSAGCTVYAKKVKLSKKTVYMTKNSTYKLKVKGTKKKAKWKSSDKKIVTVSKKGKLKAKNYGTATITVKVNGKKLNCKVVVERKSAARARKLRNYVLSKGKYDKSVKGYVLKNSPSGATDDYVMRTSVTAWKGNYDLEFLYYMAPDSPESRTTTRIKINLISGTASVKEGSAFTHYKYIDEWNDDTIEGTINTSFNGKGAGITLKKAVEMKEDYPNPKYIPYTDPTDLKRFADTMNTRLTVAFKAWNSHLSKNKTLKKDKITMTSIGFSSWK